MMRLLFVFSFVVSMGAFLPVAHAAPATFNWLGEFHFDHPITDSEGTQEAMDLLSISEAPDTVGAPITKQFYVNIHTLADNQASCSLVGLFQLKSPSNVLHMKEVLPSGEVCELSLATQTDGKILLRELSDSVCKIAYCGQMGELNKIVFQRMTILND